MKYLLLLLLPLALQAGHIPIYFGTYTKGASQGIYRGSLDTKTGKLKNLGLAVKAKNPSFLVAHPRKPWVFAVSEIGEGKVSSYIVQEDGSLVLANQRSSGGSAPCHISLDRTGRTLLVANYGNGSIASYHIDLDGFLSEPVSVITHQGSSAHPKRQLGPHAHSIDVNPDNNRVYVADLGIDKLMIYNLAKGGALSPATPPSVALEPLSGPRHVAQHFNRRNLYVLNEMNRSIAAFAVDKTDGQLALIQRIDTLPKGAKPRGSTAEIAIHPTGRYLYASNRGHDSIAVYEINYETGRLTLLDHSSIIGKTPRHFAITPDGRFLLAAGQNSSDIHSFHICPVSGTLKPVFDGKCFVPNPVCIIFP